MKEDQSNHSINDMEVSKQEMDPLAAELALPGEKTESAVLMAGTSESARDPLAAAEQVIRTLMQTFTLMQIKVQEGADRRQALLAAQAREQDLRQIALDAQKDLIDKQALIQGAEVEQRVEHRKEALEKARAALKERLAAIDEEVAESVAERKASFDLREESLQTELDRLRGQLQSADRMSSLFEGLKKQLGGREPELVLADLEAKQNELRRLREAMAKAPPAEHEEHVRLLAEGERLATRNADLTRELEEAKVRLRGEGAIQHSLNLVQEQKNWLSEERDAIQARCNQLKAENQRLVAAYQRTEDREERIKDIERWDHPAVAPRLLNDPGDELAWLASIDRGCKDYGIHFHPRILKAFHTSLKTAEWSPLTVLTGVSGTGKSELPRLYAHFGGMTFKSLPVQPNWDSQEAMLGYFNSIDNIFDAQPVLRLLARSQTVQDDKKFGLNESMVIILLDEMNLAHAELYFSEFLSKLELRRGSKGDLPSLEVKLGAGILPYELPLGRNVLWTGTMNQDETTKSLSDKVLDRSFVIHFPRPERLERRRKLMPLPPAAPLLHRRAWGKWWKSESAFSDAEIEPFKGMVESVNEAMSKVGRALGHRVWQSIEYYMANYPDTLAAQAQKSSQALKQAMRTAFEDQLVMKVMPKLRGIETRGKSKTDCLDRIRNLLLEQDYDILEDFDLSCEFGYGQFIWQTSSFLREKAPEQDALEELIPGLEAATAEPLPEESELPAGLSPR